MDYPYSMAVEFCWMCSQPKATCVHTRSVPRKASELTEGGYYWFTPGDDSPPSILERYTGRNTELVYLVTGLRSEAGKFIKFASFSFARGPGHSEYDAMLCGGEFIGPLKPPVAGSL